MFNIYNNFKIDFLFILAKNKKMQVNTIQDLNNIMLIHFYDVVDCKKIKVECQESFDFLVSIGCPHVVKVDRHSSIFFIDNPIFSYKDVEETDTKVIYKNVTFLANIPPLERGNTFDQISYEKKRPNIFQIKDMKLYIEYDHEEMILHGGAEVLKKIFIQIIKTYESKITLDSVFESQNITLSKYMYEFGFPYSTKSIEDILSHSSVKEYTISVKMEEKDKDRFSNIMKNYGYSFSFIE
jgi:hypothetical protein